MVKKSRWAAEPENDNVEPKNEKVENQQCALLRGNDGYYRRLFELLASAVPNQVLGDFRSWSNRSEPLSGPKSVDGITPSASLMASSGNLHFAPSKSMTTCALGWASDTHGHHP